MWMQKILKQARSDLTTNPGPGGGTPDGGGGDSTGIGGKVFPGQGDLLRPSKRKKKNGNDKEKHPDRLNRPGERPNSSVYQM